MKKQKPSTTTVNATKPVIEPMELKTITEFIISKIQTEKIICFGSVIKNTQNNSCFINEEAKETQELNSYYLLVIPSRDEPLADVAIQQMEEDLKTTACLTIIVHRMEEINQALENGSSFFTTIYKKGTVLYDNDQEQFVVPAPGKPLNKRLIKREAFWQHWFALSDGFLKGAVFYKSENNNSLAVFMLHQALQHCYSGMLRVLTGYRSNSNGLRRLLKLIDNILPGSSFASVKNTPEDARLTGLLLKGFGDARYNDKFEITRAELDILISRIEKILQTANTTCLQRIQGIKEGKIPYIA